MRRALVATVVLGVLAGCGGAATETQSSAPSATTPTPGTSGTTATEPTDTYAAPDPDASYSASCDYLLGDFTESKSGFRFVGDARVQNTGNIGIVSRVRAKWLLAGGDEVTAQKRVRVRPGKSKRVGLLRVATQDQIDRHQSLGLTTQSCKVKATIVDTFGQVKPQ